MKLFTALENEVDDEPTSEYRQRIQSLEEQLSSHEIVEAYDEVQADKNISDNAKTDVGTLTKVNDILVEATESNKVLTKDVLQMSKVVTESICARLGYRATDKLFMATEGVDSFSKFSDAISTESFGEVIKRTWEAIIKFFQRIIDGIKNLWSKLFSRSGVEKNKNNNNLKLIEEIQKTPKSQLVIKKPSVEDTVEVSDIFKFLIYSQYLKMSDNLETNKRTVSDILSSANGISIDIAKHYMADINIIIGYIEKIYSEDNEANIHKTLEAARSEFIETRKSMYSEIGLSVKYLNDELIVNSPYNSSSNQEATKLYKEYGIVNNEHRKIYAYTTEADKLKTITDDNIELNDLLYGLHKKAEGRIEYSVKKIIKELESSFNDKSKIAEDPLLKLKYSTINKLNKILTFYTFDLQRVMSDIVTLTRSYVNKNIQAVKKNSAN